MTPKELDRALKAKDLGDDLFEDENRLFDTSYTPIPRADFDKAMAYANKKTAPYWSDFDKHYLRADCNRFHFSFLGHMQDWFTYNANYSNPPLGRAYGFWLGQNHCWGYAYLEAEGLKFINWGEEEWPESYDGRGSQAV